MLLAVSACCAGEVPLGTPYLLIFLGTRWTSALGLEENGNFYPLSPDFSKCFLFLHKVKPSVKSYVMGAGYQYFKEHWYGTSLEEAEAPEFSCVPISPLANLLPFPWHEQFLGFLHRFLPKFEFLPVAGKWTFRVQMILVPARTGS